MFLFSLPDFARKESFESVALREVEVLYRVALRIAINPSDAEDLVGQTLLNAATHWKQFDGKHPRSWLIKILRNEWLQVIRKRRLREEVPLSNVEEPTDSGFWNRVERKLDTEAVLRALDTLEEPYRLALTLCDIEGWNYAEAAEALDLPNATLRTHLHRGRKLLQNKLMSLSVN